MSVSKRLIINCGASRVTAAVISSHGGSLQIDKLVTEDLQYDFSNEEAILPSVGAALKVLAQTHKLSGKATLIIPGNQVLTKTIRINRGVRACSRQRFLLADSGASKLAHHQLNHSPDTNI